MSKHTHTGHCFCLLNKSVSFPSVRLRVYSVSRGVLFMSSVLIFEILALDIHNELLAVSLWRFKGSELSRLYDIIALPHILSITTTISSPRAT